MTDQGSRAASVAPGRNGRPPLLQADEETLEKFADFGARGLTQREKAHLLGVHPHTVLNFYARAPQAKRACLEGARRAREERAAEWNAERAQLDAELARARETRARQAAVNAAERGGKPAAGIAGSGPCPTCGHVPQEETDQITFTVAELAAARRKFEELLDRHISARRADGDAEQPG